jgi:hypothetical protein
MANEKETRQLTTERQREVARSIARGMFKSVNNRFGPEKAVQVLNAVKGIAEALSPDTQPEVADPIKDQESIDELQRLATASELSELQNLVEVSEFTELPEFNDEDLKTDTNSKESV